MPRDTTDWESLLTAFLHDPPDKAIDIRRHEQRTLRYLSKALDRQIDGSEIKTFADAFAAISERLPMPTAGTRGERAVGPEDGLVFFHPLSGERVELEARSLHENVIAQCIEDAIEGLTGTREKFLALWRLLPELLDSHDTFYGKLPADTRVPDHTIWNHLDTTVAFQAAEKGSFVSFALGPVQPFIASARSVRDLLSGSLILSWLCFNAMLPIIEEIGPTAFVYPSLRGLPMLDWWMHVRGGLNKVKRPDSKKMAIPCLPNRFLALVPAGANGEDAASLAADCEDAARKAWHEICVMVRSGLSEKLKTLCLDWDKRWDAQVSSFFDFRAVSLPFSQINDVLIKKLLGRDLAPQVRGMAGAIPAAHRPTYSQNSAGRWQALVELSAKVMETTRAVRHVPVVEDADALDRSPPKCSLMGSYEQLGPDELAESAKFWDAVVETCSFRGVSLRKGERLCSIALVKKFFGPLFFHDHFGDNLPAFPDTATVAASLWLKRAKIDPREVRREYGVWSGQWLHWKRKDAEKHEADIPDELWKRIQTSRNVKKLGPAPTYYAVLMLDGDDMGRWLRGEFGPRVKDVLHPKMLGYFEGLGAGAKEGLDAIRPVGPAMHAALSQALANFALHAVPEIVEEHGGVLVYAGGDDVLALLPVETALTCALRLRQAFRGQAENGSPEGYLRCEGRDLLMMGGKATVSGGLAIVHHKQDLRQALANARSAEKEAKSMGRDALVIRSCRRSGEHASALCPWDYVDIVEKMIKGFLKGASDRFAYHLAGVKHVLTALSPELMIAEIKRLIRRTEPDTRQKLTGQSDADASAAIVAGWFNKYHGEVKRRCLNDAQALDGFITICQTATFLARGRDQ